jgi:hypothetical protein
MITIRKANNIIDVFASAMYWGDWARYKRVGKTLEFVKGKKLTQADLLAVKKQLGV